VVNLTKVEAGSRSPEEKKGEASVVTGRMKIRRREGGRGLGKGQNAKGGSAATGPNERRDTEEKREGLR